MFNLINNKVKVNEHKALIIESRGKRSIYLSSTFSGSYMQSGIAFSVNHVYGWRISLDQLLHNLKILPLHGHVKRGLPFLIGACGEARLLLEKHFHDFQMPVSRRGMQCSFTITPSDGGKATSCFQQEIHYLTIPLRCSRVKGCGVRYIDSHG